MKTAIKLLFASQTYREIARDWQDAADLEREAANRQKQAGRQQEAEVNQ